MHSCYLCKKLLEPPSIINLVQYQDPTPCGRVTIEYYIHTICLLDYALTPLKDLPMTNELHFQILEKLLQTIKELQDKNIESKAGLN